MPNPERCRDRAQQCRRMAEVVSDPRDRAQWLKLAEDWMAVSQIRFQSDSTADERHVRQTGLLRGQFARYRTN